MKTFDPFAIHTAEDAWKALDLSPMDGEDMEAKQQIMDVCRAYQGTFADEQGRFVLEDLANTYVRHVRIAQPGDDQVQIGIRQGAADAVWRILALIRIAETGGA